MRMKMVCDDRTLGEVANEFLALKKAQKIEKKHIHALFLRREESEVILDPKYLTEVVQVPKMEHTMNIEQTM